MAPRNVRLVDAGGGQHPVELAYQGIDHRGLHVWVATTITPMSDTTVLGCRLEAELVPGRTVIHIFAEQP